MYGYEDLVKQLHKMAVTHGVDTDMESVTGYQDMIGHSSTEQLQELANDDKLKFEFYRLYGLSYGTVEAIRFFAKNSDGIQDMRNKIDDLECDLEDAKKDGAMWMDKAENMREAWLKEKESREDAEQRIALQEREIIELKARLYDLLTK